VSGDIHQQTGSSKKAADWIGDRSTAVVEKHYILTRDANLEEAAELVTATVSNSAQPKQIASVKVQSNAIAPQSERGRRR
jgi:hypothetical protein